MPLLLMRITLANIRAFELTVFFESRAYIQAPLAGL